jgi:hypothetical protein
VHEGALAPVPVGRSCGSLTLYAVC